MSRQAAQIDGTLKFLGTQAGSTTFQAPDLGSNLTFIFPSFPGNADQALAIASIAEDVITLGYATIPASSNLSSAPQDANTVFAGPATGSPAAPAFRALVAADLPAGVAFLASPTFTGTVVVPTLSVTSQAIGRSDVCGTVAISNPATSMAVVYANPFTQSSAPTVVFTALGADPAALGGVWVTNQGSGGNWTGFTIHVTTTPGSSATFNYHVIGQANPPA
jgi:hypothetical protein